MSIREICIKLLRIEKSIKKYRNRVTNIDHILTIDICSEYYKLHGTHSEQFGQLHRRCEELRNSCDNILAKFNGIRIDNERVWSYERYNII